MRSRSALLDAIGGEEQCRRLSAAFYARVGRDPALRELFPGKSLKCATEEFAAFLIQILDGDEGQTQRRWWLSLRESHARFRIGARERAAWLKQMRATLNNAGLDDGTRQELLEFFERSSSYVIGDEAAPITHRELAQRWAEQRFLDEAVHAIAAGNDEKALALAPRFGDSPSVFVGLLARMMQAGRPELVGFVTGELTRSPGLAAHRFHGRTLLHFACAAGCLEVVRCLLADGADANAQDSGGHGPLYSVANECGSEAGPEVVRFLIEAGADVNACGGVMRATALHMAARRGNAAIARELLRCGASVKARDINGVTPLERAISCRRSEVVRLLQGVG